MARGERAVLGRLLVEHFKMSVPALVQLQNRSQVAGTVAVVRRRPHRAERLVEEVLVALHRRLVRATHQLQTVDLIELMRDITAEDPAGAAEVALESR